MNALSVHRSALTSAVRSAPRTTPSPRRQPASIPPATKTICRFCGGRPHQTRSECPAYGTKCTVCNRLHHFADVCESRHNPLPSQSQDTVSPHTADVDACSPAPVDDLVAVHQDAGHSNQLHVRHIATHRHHTAVKPDRSGKPCPHSPSTPRSGSKIHIQRAGTSVAPSSGSEHAARIACSCPVDVDAGTNAVPFALCRNFQNCRSAVDSDILSSFFPSLIFFSDLIVFRSEGKGR